MESGMDHSDLQQPALYPFVLPGYIRSRFRTGQILLLYSSLMGDPYICNLRFDHESGAGDHRECEPVREASYLRDRIGVTAQTV